jgi:hypothetical protein
MILALTTKQIQTEEDARNVCKFKYASMNIIELILPDIICYKPGSCSKRIAVWARA